MSFDLVGPGFIEFSWDGEDECDQASGRGRATLTEGGTLTGHVFIHMGEDSSFRAKPFTGDDLRDEH